MARKYLKYTAEEIDEKLSLVDEKMGDAWFNPSTNTQYLFLTTDDKLRYLSGDTTVFHREIPFEFTGILKRVSVVNKMSGNTLYFTTTGQSALIHTSFLSQQKEITALTWEEVMEDAYVSVYVDKGSTGTFEAVVSERLVLYGNSYTVDVFKYLATGANRVRVTYKGAVSEEQGSIMYAVNLTTMYLAPANFAWNNVFLEENTYHLGGVNIGGNLNKTLKVKMSHTELGYERLYEQNIGTATYTTNSYFFKGLEFPSTGTGVYDVELWLDANGLESDHLYYKIICVSTADKLSTKLIAVADVPDSLVNYDNNVLFSYVVYNCGMSVASPTVRVESDLGVLVSETLKDVSAGTINSYSAPIEIETEDTSLQIRASITFGNTESMSYALDNSASFPAVPEAVFYLQPSGRSNEQANKEIIINQATGEEVSAQWSGVNFVDGIDGYTTIKGRKCLYLPAFSRMNMDEQPLASIGKEGKKTIEINFMVDNIADYNEPVISICDDPTNSKFRGILVYPDRVIVHTRDLNTNDLVQSYSFGEGQPVNLQISYAVNYNVNYGNLITIAVNGTKKCDFSFSSSDNVTVPANVIFGSNSSDLSIYSMRVYDIDFDTQKIMQNFVNSLPTKEERTAAHNLIQSAIDDSYNISYDAVKGKMNTMVIKMLNGAELPHYGLGKEYSAYCDVEFDFCSLPKDFQIAAWSFILKICRIEGQGTTSMNYWLWNLRFRIDKSGNLIVIYPDGTEATAGKVWFDGVGIHPMVNRITAKKNYASQMQCNKMGATAAFNDLHEALGIANEAGGRVAVYQYPVFAFVKELKDGTTDQYSYKFIGMYTVGPDKGDKSTFGWDNPDIKDSMLSLEGLDHNIKGAGYDYPYDKLKYSASAESIVNDKGEKATEVSNSGSAETEEETQAKLDAEYKPAFLVAYENNPLIKGTTASLSEMNANTEAWGLQRDEDGHAFQRYEFWRDGEYDILYLNKKSNLYEKNGINLLTQLDVSASELEGLTLAEKNQLFIEKRVARFRENASLYWHLRDNMFAMVFKQLFAAKDNGIKNTYPYKLSPLSEGGRWMQRQDDLDSLFSFDNQSLSSAKFWQEIFDFSNEDKTAYVYKGEHNVLDHLLLMAFPELEKEIAHEMLDAMQELSKYGSTSIDKLKGFFRTYFWDRAQYYFPKSVYNKDTEYGYEEAWPKYVSGEYDVDVNPLAQVRGDALEQMMDFVEKHLIYMMSKYQYGPFGANGYNDTSLGRINFRTQLSQSLTLTPAIPLYPAVANGVNTVNATSRVMDGEEVTISGVGGTNTNVYIMAAHYLSDIGDLSNLQVDSNQDAVLGVSSKRLKRLKVGDELAENVTSNLAGLNVGDCPSLTLIDARNLASLSGMVDLSRCPRLQEALFAATDAREIKLQNGSKITKLSLPDSLTTLALMNLKNLSAENIEFGSLGKVEFFRVEGCGIDAFSMLKTLYNTENSLKYIKLIGFAYDGDATDIDFLASLAESCKGINGDGNGDDTILPVVEGTLNIDGLIYEDTETEVRMKYPGLILNVKGGYYVRFADPEVQRVLVSKVGDGIGLTTEDIEGVTSIGTWFKENKIIQSFNELEKFTGLTSIYGNFVSSGNFSGAFYNCKSLLSVKLSPSVTNIMTCAFRASSALQTIGDLLNIKEIGSYAFYGCTSLSMDDVATPNLETLGGYSFYGTKIKKYSDFGKVTTIPTQTFRTCSELSEINLENITTIGDAVFAGTAITVIDAPNLNKILSDQASGTFQGMTALERVNSLGKITTIPTCLYYAGVFHGCSKLKYIDLPNTLTNIGAYTFNGCKTLEIIVCNAVNPPTLESNVFNNTNSTFKIYVPDGDLTQTITNEDGTTEEVTKAIVDWYKEATNWSTYASRIYPMTDSDVCIIDIDGASTPFRSWNTANNANAVGVAVITDDCSFMLDGTTYETTWGNEADVAAQDNKAGYPNSSDGRINTQWHVENKDSSTRRASFRCYETIFANGQKGYLPSKKELTVLYAHKDAVNEALTMIGKTAISSANGIFASTHSSYPYLMNWSNGIFSTVNATLARTVIPFTELPSDYEQ